MTSTFYYTKSPLPHLEVCIASNYTEADLNRILLMLDALVDDPEMQVIFKVPPTIKKEFRKNVASLNWPPLYYYNIKEYIL